MKREIKFKAWNNEDKAMYVPISISICNDGKLRPLRICKDGNYSYKDDEIIKFTGLKDKNGKEIFEGDSNGIYIVTFENGCFKLKTKRNNIVGLLSNFIDEFEVIGNIFENESLLNEQSRKNSLVKVDF